MIYYDGHYYDTEADEPDLGSLVGIANLDGTRSYTGLLSDESKLPKYSDLMSGSSASLLSTSGLTVYMYEATTKTWYKL